MNLEEKINTDLKTAMLNKDEVAVRSLRAVKSAILIAKTSGSSAISQDDEVRMLQKLVKQRKESLEIYKQQSRDDLTKTETEEIAIIEKYLPKQMSEGEIKEELKKIITQTGATTAAEMGKVMGIAAKQLAGKADNKLVSELVKQLLS